MLDLVVHGGAVFDGLGNPAQVTDVGVVGGRIVELGNLAVIPATLRLDATDRLVLPGFVDLHSHSDLTVLSDGRARSKLHQGVTTEVVGNCGLGPFPCGSDATLRAVRSAVTLIDLDPAVDWVWTDLSGYRQAVRAARPSLNIVALVGHIPLRLLAEPNVVGALDVRGRDRLTGLLDEAINMGAAGCSTGLMYPPAIDADMAELVALGRVVARYDRLFSMHLRNYSDHLVEAVEEALEVARVTGCRLQISHLAVAGRANWGTVPRALERIDLARNAGLDVAFDLYPYLAGSANLTQILPTWAQAGGTNAMLSRLRNPSDRLQIMRGWTDTPFLGWDEIEISWVGANLAEILGLDIAEIGRRWGVDPAEAALDVMLKSENRAAMVAYGRSEADLLAALNHPAAMIGSDGLSLDPNGPTGLGRPHPRSYGCYPRLLGPYVRRGLISMDRAVELSTSLPADRIGLIDRGRIKLGAVADLVVLDAATVVDCATFRQPAQFPEGVEAVVVGGALALKSGTQRDDIRTGAMLTTFR